MAAERLDKIALRTVWADVVEELDIEWDPSDGHPIYLTLPGALGLDVQHLIDRGIVSRTEAGAVEPEDAKKVVAVESNPQAELEFRRRFPGIKVLPIQLRELLHGEGPFNWPSKGEQSDICRALFVNLDFNSSLQALTAGNQVVFPVVQLVEKFAQLHRKAPAIESWTLGVTLNATIEWSDSVWSFVREFLRENFILEPEFESRCTELIGKAAVQSLLDGGTLTASAVRQRLLMALVPKAIASAVIGQGWMVSTMHNYAYGGASGSAEMVSFVLRFDRPEGHTDVQLYRAALREALARAAMLDKDGTLVSAVSL